MYLRIEKGKNLGRSLEVLGPILSNWQRLVEEFVVDRKDGPWWYNERASLSLFAGAVWSCKGGWAFEEFSTRKWARKGKKRRKTRPGRCDLQFGIGEDITFVAEAKQVWPNIGSRVQSGMITVRANLQKARDESSRLPNNKGTKLGMLFVVPRIPRSKRKQVDKILRSFLERLSKRKNTTMAWVFPAETKSLSYKGDNFLYPGVVVLIQRSRRKQR